MFSNNINVTVSQESCDKIAGIAKYIPSADAGIFGFKYNETEEAKISRNYGAFDITGSYKKGTGLNLSIGISDDLIDLGVNAIYTFVPAICGAVCSLAGHVGRLKKLLKINDDHEPVRVKHGDKIKLIYTIGRRNTTSKVITVGLAEMGENIDHMLTGMRCGRVYRDDIDVMGTKVPISIMVDKIIERTDDAKHQIGKSDDDKKICGGMRLPDDFDNDNIDDEVKSQIAKSDEFDNANIDDEVKQYILGRRNTPLIYKNKVVIFYKTNNFKLSIAGKIYQRNEIKKEKNHG